MRFAHFTESGPKMTGPAVSVGTSYTEVLGHLGRRSQGVLRHLVSQGKVAVSVAHDASKVGLPVDR